MSPRHLGAAWSLGTMLLLGSGSALADSCTDLAPPTLRMQLESRFPGFAFPHEYDNAPADVALHHDRSGSSCLGVVQEDLDGDGRDDLAIALTALDGEGALIVAVHDAAGSASVATLDQQRRGAACVVAVHRQPGGLRAHAPGSHDAAAPAVDG